MANVSVYNMGGQEVGTIEVSDSEGVFLTYEFYVYSYCYTILKGESYAETLKNIAKTMYRYGQACAAYYGT